MSYHEDIAAFGRLLAEADERLEQSMRRSREASEASTPGVGDS